MGKKPERPLCRKCSGKAETARYLSKLSAGAITPSGRGPIIKKAGIYAD
jgi:hypothetical protein